VIDLLRSALTSSAQYDDARRSNGKAALPASAALVECQIQSFTSRDTFLDTRDATLRRPPIAPAPDRLRWERTVRFGTETKKLGCRVVLECFAEEFVDFATLIWPTCARLIWPTFIRLNWLLCRRSRQGGRGQETKWSYLRRSDGSMSTGPGRSREYPGAGGHTRMVGKPW